jgi:ferredoxin-NADP reductase
VCDVVGSVQETPTVRSLILRCPGWPGHLPGQHVDVRLTAEDGYQAERSYSLAQPWQSDQIQLTVQRLPDGEVSPYLCDEVLVGDQLELRGPIGGYFVWRADETAPALLLGGGSGVVPLAAILAARAAAARTGRGLATRLLVSTRSIEDFIYRAALEQMAAETAGIEVVTTLTRSHPAAWSGYSRRVDREIMQAVAWPPESGATAFVCGPTGFVEAIADHLVDLGYPPERIRTERFGPTGV